MFREGGIYYIGRDYIGGAYGISPISGNYWSNYAFGSDYNASLMSNSDFNAFYGITDDNRADFAEKWGVSANVYISSSDESGDIKSIDMGAAATAWIFDGKLIDVTYGGTLVWGDYYGDPHIINGSSTLSFGIGTSCGSRS